MGHGGKHFHAVFVPKLLNLQGIGSQLESKIGRIFKAKFISPAALRMNKLHHFRWLSWWTRLSFAVMVSRQMHSVNEAQRYLGAEVLELSEAGERASQAPAGR